MLLACIFFFFLKEDPISGLKFGRSFNYHTTVTLRTWYFIICHKKYHDFSFRKLMFISWGKKYNFMNKNLDVKNESSFFELNTDGLKKPSALTNTSEISMTMLKMKLHFRVKMKIL